MNKKKILWFTWKDKKNPLAGGAEIVNEELAKRLVQDGNQVKLIVGGYTGAEAREVIDGYEIIRVGGRWTVYWQAYKYYQQNLKGWADLVIDKIHQAISWQPQTNLQQGLLQTVEYFKSRG